MINADHHQSRSPSLWRFAKLFGSRSHMATTLEVHTHGSGSFSRSFGSLPKDSSKLVYSPARVSNPGAILASRQPNALSENALPYFSTEGGCAKIVESKTDALG